MSTTTNIGRSSENNESKLSNNNETKSITSNQKKKPIDKKKWKKNAILNPAIAIGAFNGTILLYYLLRYFLVDSKMEFSKPKFFALTGVFIVIVLTTQITLYTMVSQAQHGKKNIVASILFAVITNVLYVGSVMILLFLLPGFKEPFSNTFGYLIVYLFGVKYAMNRLLLSSDEGGDIVKEYIKTHRY